MENLEELRYKSQNKRNTFYAICIVILVILGSIWVSNYNPYDKLPKDIQNCFEVHYPTKIDTVCFYDSKSVNIRSEKGTNYVGHYLETTAIVKKIK